MTDKLSLFNEALTEHLDVDKLSSLSENVPHRHALDQVWDRDFVDTVLQKGQWDFAARTQLLEDDPSVTPPFGYQFAFARPANHVRTMAVCTDEYLRAPLLDYEFEGAYWYADHDEIYVRFVSNDLDFGGDFSLWPPNFTRFAACNLAVRSRGRIAGKGIDKDDLKKTCKGLLREAQATDAQERPSVLPPLGSWSRSRTTRLGDRGSRRRLIG